MRRPRKFMAGGFVPPGMPFWMQRTDQGQDFEIPLGQHLVAPGWGQCINHLHDGAFPNGFGSPYAVIRLGSGRFKGLDLYLGHGNADVIPIGHIFHSGDKLVKLTNSLNRGRGWVEIGVCHNGLPQADGTGAKYHHLFKPISGGADMTAPLKIPEPQSRFSSVPPPSDAGLPVAFPAEAMTRTVRLHPNVTVRHQSPNYSSRSSSIKLIVIHATESSRRPDDLANLGDWFGQTQAQVSAHVGTDAYGNSGRYVEDVQKAWHVAGYNSPALGVEQIGWSADSTAAWEGHGEMEICETARWVARWSKQYGIPIRKGRVSGGRVLLSGVVRHSDLGTIGGNHGDPGRGYCMERMLQWARYYRARI